MPRRAAAAGCLLATLLASCSARVDDPGAAKAGADRPLTLTAADSQPDGRPSTRFLRLFADEVEARSDGSIEIRVVPDAGSNGPSDDQPIIDGLEAGAFDLASVPVRAWAAAHPELAPLQAPFELVSMEQMDAAAADAQVVETVGRALDGGHAHLLALYPESLRYLVSAGDPVTRPSDLRGMTIWSITPRMAELLAPTGATATPLPESEAVEAMRARNLGGVEIDLERATASDLFIGSSTAGDLPLTAKFQTLAMGSSAWSRLSQEQRSVVEQAAAAARQRLAEERPDVAGQVSAFCSHGGAVVVAGPARLATFRDAVRPATSSLDPTLLERMRTIAARVGDPSPPLPCDGRPAVSAPAGAAAGFPDGVYRLEWDDRFARRWNGEHDPARAILFGPAELSTLPAVVTWTMAGGTYTFEIQFRDEEPVVVEGGRYSVDGDELTIALLPDVGNVTNVVRFTVADDGTVTFRQVDGLPLDPYFAVPWTRVGDP